MKKANSTVPVVVWYWYLVRLGFGGREERKSHSATATHQASVLHGSEEIWKNI